MAYIVSVITQLLSSDNPDDSEYLSLSGDGDEDSWLEDEELPELEPVLYFKENRKIIKIFLNIFYKIYLIIFTAFFFLSEIIHGSIEA